MSRKFWESNLIDDFNKVNISFSRFMEIHKQVSSNTPYFLDSMSENEKESHFLLLLSALTNEELKSFYNKIDIPLTEINDKYSIREFSDHPVVFNDNGFLAQIKFLTKDNETFICSYDANNNLIEDITSPISSILSLDDSVKEYINNTLLKSNSKQELEFNPDKYFLGLYSKYIDLTSKGIECDIYVGSPAGHYFITKEQLVKEFDKDNATSYLLADVNGQCIFNKDIFEKENKSEILRNTEEATNNIRAMIAAENPTQKLDL